MRINTNVNSLNAQRNLQVSGYALSKALERLSSGKRVNRAGDDAAGLAIGQKLQAQVRGLGQAIRNAQDGISMIQTAEGALDESQSILQRMRELAVQAANGTLAADERSKITAEFQNLQAELTRIAQTTQFGDAYLLNGNMAQTTTAVGSDLVASAGFSGVRTTGAVVATTYTIVVASAGSSATQSNYTLTVMRGSTGSVGVLAAIQFGAFVSAGAPTVQVSVAGIQFDVVGSAIDGAVAEHVGSANSVFTVSGGASMMLGTGNTQLYDALQFGISNMTAGSAGLAVGSLQVDTASNAQDALSKIMVAIGSVSTERAKLGALQNRMEHTIKNLSISFENLSASQSRIIDADFAMEVAMMVRGQILQQAGTSVAAQANQLPQSVLQLLRG
ncbi:MAG: flagellin [Dehalococcoidia bacterium]|nr:MAG: flagellin [Dehalococcoidia bacterium]